VPAAAGQLTYLAYRAAAAAAEALPVRAGEAIAGVAGRAAHRTMRGRAAVVARHQRRAGAAGNDGSVRAVFDSYARYWLELLRLPADVRRGRVMPHFSAEGFGHVEDSVARGRGTIVALPHLGGWEHAAAWMHGLGHDLLAVVEPIEPPALREWFARQRRAFGVEIVPLGPDVATRVLRALRDNRIVCLLSDRDLTGDGVEVEFFGERTTLPAGPATLALRTGATLLPAGVYFRPGRDHHAVIRPPVPVARAGRLRDDVARITQALACELELLIRRAPQQWHLMQPNWPSDRLGRGEWSACAS
jgi:KDO2-lipid IV(A) lauroyltransferase